jgi:deoxyribodipyrimidine photo-lyase
MRLAAPVAARGAMDGQGMAGGDAQHDDGRGTGPIVIWFRRDLRLHDHPALTAALAAGRPVAPLFVFDEALLRGRWPAPNRVWFMRESVRALGDRLRERGGGLAIRVGQPEVVVAEFAAEVRASTVYVTRDYGPYARGRDRRSRRRWRGAGSASPRSAACSSTNPRRSSAPRGRSTPSSRRIAAAGRCADRAPS